MRFRPQKDSELSTKKPAPLTSLGLFTVASRYSLQLVLFSCMILLTLVDLISLFLWTYLAQEETIRTSKERAVKLGRNITGELNSLGQNIVQSLDKHPQPDVSSPESIGQKFIDISANFEGREETHLLRLDSQNVIKQVSRMKDRKWLGEIFDNGSKIHFLDLSPNLSVSELLASLDQKTPFFEWRQKDKNTTYILQIALTEFGNWCKQISLIDRQNVFLSISSTGKTYSRFDCNPQRNYEDLWKKHQITVNNDPSQTSFRFQGNDYLVSTHRPDVFPVNIIIFTKIPNTKNLLSENTRLLYPLLAGPALIILLIFLIFRLRINEHVLKIRWLTSALQNNMGQPIDRLHYSPEFEPAFSSLKTMYDTLGQSHAKNSIKTKLSTELGVFLHPDDLLGKATELLGTQSKSESSFFLPFNSIGEKKRLKGWSWMRHSTKEIHPSDQDETRSTIDAQNTFKIPVTIRTETYGDFYLVRPNLPEKTLIEIATTLVSLIENAFERNKTHKREALNELENFTMESLQAFYKAPWQLNNAKYELASFYILPAKNSGEFIHFISSPKSDDFIFVIGGPSGNIKSRATSIDQIKISPISWTIKGIMDGYRRVFETSVSSSKIKTSEIILALQKVVHDFSDGQDDSWSFFACHYDASISSLIFSSSNKDGPFLLRKKGVPTEQLFDKSEALSRQNSHSQDRINRNFMDQHIELMSGDMLLLMVGNASTCQNDRHKIFHEILFRRLLKVDQTLSATQIRDTIKSFQTYYYQDQPPDKDLCFLVLQCLDDKPNQEAIDKSALLVS